MPTFKPPQSNNADEARAGSFDHHGRPTSGYLQRVAGLGLLLNKQGPAADTLPQFALALASPSPDDGFAASCLTRIRSPRQFRRPVHRLQPPTHTLEPPLASAAVPRQRQRRPLTGEQAAGSSRPTRRASPTNPEPGRRCDARTSRHLAESTPSPVDPPAPPAAPIVRADRRSRGGAGSRASDRRHSRAGDFDTAHQRPLAHLADMTGDRALNVSMASAIEDRGGAPQRPVLIQRGLLLDTRRRAAPCPAARRGVVGDFDDDLLSPIVPVRDHAESAHVKREGPLVNLTVPATLTSGGGSDEIERRHVRRRPQWRCRPPF